MIGQVIGRGSLGGPPGGDESAREWIVGPHVKAVNVFLGVNNCQHRQTAGVIRRLLDGALQIVAGHDVLFGGDALEISKAVQQRFVGRELIGAFRADRFAHAVRQHAVRIGDGRNDARDQVVLQLENRFGAERAIVSLGPQMRSGIGVDQLHRDAHFGSGLAQAALHHVARAELFAGGAHVDQFLGVARAGTARDHAQVGEAREAGDDVFA